MLVARIPESIDMALNDLAINRLCDLLYEISVKVSEFYAHVKVLGNENEKSIILLLEATRKAMKTLFDLLGMQTIKKI